MRQKVNINKIKANPNNPRIIKDEKFKKLVKSIKDFPEMLEKRPIIVDENLVILGGNMRLKACKEAGLKEVYIDIAKDWSEEQKKEFVVKDNLGYGEWDFDILSIQYDMEELEDWGMDMEFDIKEENTEEKEGEGEGDDINLDDISIPSIGNNVVRGLMVPVLQKEYENCFKEFKLALSRGVDVGHLLHNLLKYENSEAMKGKNN